MSGKLNWEKQKKLDKLRNHKSEEPPDWRVDAEVAKFNFYGALRAKRMLKSKERR